MSKKCWFTSARTAQNLLPTSLFVNGFRAILPPKRHLAISPNLHASNWGKRSCTRESSASCPISGPAVLLIRVEHLLPSVHVLHLISPQCQSACWITNKSFMAYDTIISAVVHLLGVSVVSHLISRRALVDGVQCSLKRASWARLCVLIVFIDSYLFLFTTGVLILGIGMATSSVACSLGIYLCIVFYGTSKLFIYLFLSKSRSPLEVTSAMLLIYFSRTCLCRLASNSHDSSNAFQSLYSMHDSPHSLPGRRWDYVLW
jgi:hypothetical protein